MRSYTVLKTIDLFSGKIGLTEKQAASRSINLKKVKGGYEIVSPVQFKAGETIRLDEVSKAQRAFLVGKDENKDQDAGGE